MVPWSATEIIERCAETFLTLPVELHLGPDVSLHKLDEVELAKLGPLASLQLTRLPLSRTEVALKRVFDLVFAAAGLVLLTPLIVLVAALIAFEDRGRCSLRSAATDSISSHSASSSSAPCTPKTTVRSCRRRRATTRA